MGVFGEKTLTLFSRLTFLEAVSEEAMEAVLVGYISRLAGVLLWLLGLVITSTVIYLVYSAAVSYLPSVATWVLAVLLILAWIAILVFWATVLSRGVSGRRDKSRSRWTTICETLTQYRAGLQVNAKSAIKNAKCPIMLSLVNLREN